MNRRKEMQQEGRGSWEKRREKAREIEDRRMEKGDALSRTLKVNLPLLMSRGKKACGSQS